MLKIHSIRQNVESLRWVGTDATLSAMLRNVLHRNVFAQFLDAGLQKHIFFFILKKTRSTEFEDVLLEIYDCFDSY